MNPIKLLSVHASQRYSIENQAERCPLRVGITGDLCVVSSVHAHQCGLDIGLNLEDLEVSYDTEDFGDFRGDVAKDQPTSFISQLLTEFQEWCEWLLIWAETATHEKANRLTFENNLPVRRLLIKASVLNPRGQQMERQIGFIGSR